MVWEKALAIVVEKPDRGFQDFTALGKQGFTVWLGLNLLG